MSQLHAHCAALFALAALTLAAAPVHAQAQEDAAPQETQAAPRGGGGVVEPQADGEEKELEGIEEIVVVGSQIKGATATDLLPISVLDAADLESVGALSADELFRDLPEVGDINFNNQKTSGGVNDARGDAASINLRSFGTGNTLMLLNGRRLVNHPGYQTEDLVPVVTVNTNTLPALGVERLEVLRDGASAIYGADAVAGVINTVLKSDFEGFNLQLRGRGYSELSRDDLSLSLEYGWKSSDGRTRIGAFASYYDREPVFASERARSASRDLRPFVAGTHFEGDTDWRGLSSNTPWGEFDILQSVSGGLRALSSSTGRFHIQPPDNSGCLAQISATACIDGGSADANLRWNFNSTAAMVSELARSNLLVFVNHEFGGLEFFSELAWYQADTTRNLYASTNLSAARLYVPRNNYWNPFGPVSFSDGRMNPNRVTMDLEGNPITGIPDEGVDVQLRRYRVVDAGPRIVDVETRSLRLLAGLRGGWRGWEWESALTWSDSSSDDITHGRISNTLFQQALNDETENAYNPFNGAGAIDCYLQSWRDCTPNSQEVINSFLVDVSRKGESDLLMVDLRASRNDLFHLPAGGVGIAAGVEWRRESFVDNRDPRLDGTIRFTDLVTMQSSEFISDVMNSSPTPDSRGSRNVFSSYLEFAVPLVSPAMGLLLMQSVDMQIAARYENFSDVGSIVVPKIAMAWRLHDFLMLRGAVSEGFRAPNLVQVNESIISRENTRTDYYRCEVGLRDGSLSDVDDCPDDRVQRIASGSKALVPEESTNFNFGIVLEPNFWIFRGLALTADWWKVEKEGTVGLFGEVNHILMDTQIRLQNAQSDIANCAAATGNPAVIRAEPEADDIAFYAGSGLCPVGDILQVRDVYVNLDERTIEGWDFGLYWELDSTPLGDFSMKLNLSYIEKFYQDPSARAQSLLDAQAQGILRPGVEITGAQELLQLNGKPKIQLAGRLRWRLGDWGAGLSLRHVGKFYDTSANTAGRTWEVEDWTTVSVNFDRHLTLWDRALRLRIGATNLGNEDAPLADESYGYFGTLHNHLGRSIYFDVRVKF